MVTRSIRRAWFATTHKRAGFASRRCVEVLRCGYMIGFVTRGTGFSAPRSYCAQIPNPSVSLVRSFDTLAEAIAWVESTHEAQREAAHV